MDTGITGTITDGATEVEGDITIRVTEDGTTTGAVAGGIATDQHRFGERFQH